MLRLVRLLGALPITLAAVVPTAPGPKQSFNAGSECSLSWNLDTTNTWTSFSVDLMSGSNLAMQPVMNVFKGRDGSKGPGTYSFTCPDVTPNSAIYFYQFSQAGADTTWTTRFAIASSSGQVVPPEHDSQPAGQPIPWGIGRLTSAPADSSSPSNTTVAPASGNMTALTTPSQPSNSTASQNTSSPNATASLSTPLSASGTSATSTVSSNPSTGAVNSTLAGSGNTQSTSSVDRTSATANRSSTTSAAAKGPCLVHMAPLLAGLSLLWTLHL